ncbi:hypothetical protein SAMN02745126_03979 [Enhydrobacter aerosaccus]|uniref:Uncharacterized protein n=1 Tax=Enhydrobacter aerosaccus TaxID=225324 RepID=A0A1T4RNI2_9HYPH|nr:hypothetical protein [Enhydrobacter aerosaccus]SKA17493.1 hypothetical protein SAMN02745126_03979 [Enhydrobacter aerosaccus]
MMHFIALLVSSGLLGFSLFAIAVSIWIEEPDALARHIRAAALACIALGILAQHS